MINIIEVTSKSDLKKFIQFPNMLHRNNEKFVPMLFENELNTFSPAKNDAFSYCESHQFLAFKDNKIVGRVATILNYRYNYEKKVKQLRFSRFDVIDDLDVTKALMERVKEEAIKNDLDEIIGPMGFCDLDQHGMYESGFEFLGDYHSSFNVKYYNDHLKNLGFIKDFEWSIYRIGVLSQNAIFQDQISEFLLKKYDLKIKDLNKANNLNKYLYNSYQLRTKVIGHIYGYNQLTEKQIKYQIETNKIAINLQYSSIIIDSNDEVVAFCFAAPSIDSALKKKKGKLNIFDKIKIKKEKYNNETVYIYSLIVHHKYQNIGLEQVLLCQIINKAVGKNVKYLETCYDLEHNDKIIRNNRDLNREIIKTRCIYKLNVNK